MCVCWGWGWELERERKTQKEEKEEIIYREGWGSFLVSWASSSVNATGASKELSGPATLLHKS